MRVVLSGGGTGGHIYPALSIAKQCLQHDASTKLLYIGSTQGMEKDIVPLEHIAYEAIDISGFRRKLSWHNVKTIQRFIQGTRRSKAILKKFMPDIVIGTGGYVCGPVLYAAAKLGIPTLIHEQNVIPGLTNRFLSKYADSVAVSFQDSKGHFPKAKRVIYTGNPSATAVVKADPEKGRRSLNVPKGSKLVVIVGGSGGAKAINDAMIQMSDYIQQLPDVHFVYVTGNAYFETTTAALQQRHNSLPANLHTVSYIHNMPEVLAATHLIVNRSGASFLAEITALGLPSILIPSPNVTNNHQHYNARSLADEGAALLLPEQQLSGASLFTEIKKIVGDEQLAESMSQQARSMGQPDAAELVIAEMLQLCQVNVGIAHK